MRGHSGELIMEITKESFLHAEDSKNRDAMLFDMLEGISEKIDECNNIKDKVSECRGDIITIKAVGTALSIAFTGLCTWMGLK